MSERRRLMMSNKSRNPLYRIPAGYENLYTQHAYLMTSGASYISIPKSNAPALNDTVIWKVKIINGKDNATGMWGLDACLGTVFVSSRVTLRFGESWTAGSNNQLQLSDIDFNYFYTISWTNSLQTIIEESSGRTVSKQISSPSMSWNSKVNTYGYIIFGGHLAYWHSSPLYDYGILASYQQIRNGQYLYDMIPVMRISDNKPGLLNIAGTPTFFGKSAGSGDFTLGGQILP